MDITNQLLSGASPYISKLSYDVLKRELLILAVDNPNDMKELKRIVFPSVTHYKEYVDEIDDDLVESIIGINWCNLGEICIKTETREIFILLAGKPYAEFIT